MLTSGYRCTDDGTYQDYHNFLVSRHYNMQQNNLNVVTESAYRAQTCAKYGWLQCIT